MESYRKKSAKFFPHTCLFEDQLSYILIFQDLLEFGAKDQNKMLFLVTQYQLLDLTHPSSSEQGSPQ